MSDVVGTVRIREEDNAKSIYVKTGDNRWAVHYTSPGEAICGSCSDPVATRWPVFYRPEYVGNPE